jgi:dolichol-phosphate mannosyltransferase
MRALVTGAAGFIGANLVAHLLANGEAVVAVVRPGDDAWRLDPVRGDTEIIECDLGDPDAAKRAAVAERPEVIFHLAAHGAYSWQHSLDLMVAVNLRCTQALLEAAALLGATVVNAGSSSEYGYKDHPPREDEAVRPNSHYAVTKLAATHLCQLAADTHGVHATTLRLYSVYGPWEEPGRLMPTLVRAARAGHWPALADPGIARDYVWVHDACEAFLAAARARSTEPGAVFNVASGVQTTLGEVVAAAAEVFGVDAAPVWGGMEPRAWDTSVWVGDPARAQSELGWRATTSLTQGLEETGAWFERHPEHDARYR